MTAVGSNTLFSPRRWHLSCTSRGSCAQWSSPQEYLFSPALSSRQLLPTSVRGEAQHPQIHTCWLAVLLRNLHTDNWQLQSSLFASDKTLGSTDQQNANFCASLIKLFTSRCFISKMGLLTKSSACCPTIWLRAPTELRSSYRSTSLKSGSYLFGSCFFFCKQHSSYHAQFHL